MTTLKAKRLNSALQKVQNVGRVEESVTISGCSLVLQNLSSKEYDQIVPELKDLDGEEYLHTHMVSHLSRSIVEIEGVDLRDVQFIEDEIPVGAYTLSAVVSNEAKAKKAQELLLAETGIKLTIEPPDDTSEVKTVKLEKSEWLKRKLVSWGREAILVARLKFSEVVDKANVHAREGVQFNIPDESAADKFRRLLVEAKELEVEMPDDLLGKILSDVGYMQQSSQKELDEIHQSALAFDDERATEQAIEEREPAPSIRPLPKPPVELQPDPEVASRAATSRQIAAELMQSRQPLNQGDFTAPTPVSEYVATPRVPPQIRGAAVPSDRTAEISALEGQIDPALIQTLDQAVQANAPMDLMKQKPVDGKGVNTILNQPPVVGLNPKFRPIQKV